MTASEPELLSSLPTYISMNFPFIVMAKGGITKKLGVALLNLDAKGVGPTPFKNLVIELHAKIYHEKMLHYYSSCLAIQKFRISQGSVDPLNSRSIPLFPEFEELVSIPSSNFFRQVLVINRYLSKYAVRPKNIGITALTDLIQITLKLTNLTRFRNLIDYQTGSENQWIKTIRKLINWDQ